MHSEEKQRKYLSIRQQIHIWLTTLGVISIAEVIPTAAYIYVTTNYNSKRTNEYAFWV